MFYDAVDIRYSRNVGLVVGFVGGIAFTLIMLGSILLVGWMN